MVPVAEWRCRLGTGLDWLRPANWGMLVGVDMRLQHREIAEAAQRIVYRAQAGRLDIAAELIMRALATSNANATFALAIALTEEALKAVEESRLDAAKDEMSWQPAYRLHAGRLVTPADDTVEPMPLAIRMLDALHRGMNGDKDAVTELGKIYEVAAAAADATFHGMLAALVTYAAHARNNRIDITAEPVATHP
jgi:hypothetical protein